jgi:cytochrome c oxidase assembly protein subunit 15
MKANAVSKSNPWLYWFAVLTALATLALIGIGGLVTSHEAGMSVPDWPTTYGYNMFLFPINKWLGGIFYEHSHRLLASLVGLMTTILAVWLWLKDSRPWMSWLGVAAFLLVVAQGVLGGLRVTMHMDSLGIYHATIAQLFFVLTCAIALFTSRWWMNNEGWSSRFSVSDSAQHFKDASQPKGSLKAELQPRELWLLVLFTTVLIFIQLIIAAAMRHQHAGLAISDFPLAHGSLWPDTSAEAVASYNAQRVSINAENPITAFQIELQMAHRVVALAILLLTAGCAWLAQRWSSRFSVPDGRNNLKVELQPHVFVRLSRIWLALILFQVGLGAATIWTNKAADVATAHVLVGALALAVGALWCAIAYRETVAAVCDHRTEQRRSQRAATIGAQPAMTGNK